MQSPWFRGDLPVTQGWHPGPGAYEPGHTGIDVGMITGTHIVDPASFGAALVENKENPGGFGHYAELTPVGNPNVHVVLGHLSSFAVPDRSIVQPGTVVGVSGSTGWSTGPHLHFEEDVGGQPGTGHDVNPMGILSGASAPDTGSGPVAGASTGNLPASFFTGLLDFGKNVLGVPNMIDLLYRSAFVIVGLIIILIGVYLLFRPQINTVVETAGKGATLAAI